MSTKRTNRFQTTSSAAVFLVSTRGPDTKQLQTTLSIQGRNVSALVDTSSALIPSETIVHLASSVSKWVPGSCELDFELLGIHYPKTWREHDNNLKLFELAASKQGLEINREKSKYRLTSMKCLGYEISYNIIRPDPDRLSAVKGSKIPKDKLTLQRLMGFSAYYRKWIKNIQRKSLHSPVYTWNFH
ncbi:hypothetical protein GJ496_005112 [Pomphorhynchus laevis]|nr:hypothetical protein GJ496_005112 [Pomphorhynchus laevis]